MANFQGGETVIDKYDYMRRELLSPSIMASIFERHVERIRATGPIEFVKLVAANGTSMHAKRIRRWFARHNSGKGRRRCYRIAPIVVVGDGGL